MNQGHNDLSPPLSKLSFQIDAVTENAVALVKGLSAEQLRQRPGPNAWSVAECIRHLSITSEEYLPILEEALKRARHQLGSPKATLKMDLMGRVLKWSLEPPARFKVKTTAQFEPSGTQSIEDLPPSFATLQQELKIRIESASGLAIDQVKIASPFNKRVKYNLFSAFNILVAHQRRHIWQAEQVKQRLMVE